MNNGMVLEVVSTRRSACLGGKQMSALVKEEALKIKKESNKYKKVEVKINIEYDSNFLNDNQFSQQFGIYKKLV